MMLTNHNHQQPTMNKFISNSSALVQATVSSLLVTTEGSAANTGLGGGGGDGISIAAAAESDDDVTDVAPLDPIEVMRAECMERLNRSTFEYEPGKLVIKLY